MARALRDEAAAQGFQDQNIQNIGAKFAASFLPFSSCSKFRPGHSQAPKHPTAWFPFFKACSA